MLSKVLLVSRYSENDFYLIYDQDLEIRGWVSCGTTQRYLTRQVKLSPFSEEETGSNLPQETTVKNESSYTLSLWIDNLRYTIAPNTSRNIPISAGSHTYIASAPGVQSLTGSNTWRNGVIYNWTFYVRTVYKE